jgi:hypothetical protein
MHFHVHKHLNNNLLNVFELPPTQMRLMLWQMRYSILKFDPVFVINKLSKKKKKEKKKKEEKKKKGKKKKGEKKGKKKKGKKKKGKDTIII